MPMIKFYAHLSNYPLLIAMDQAYQNFNSGKYKEALTYRSSHIATFPRTLPTSTHMSLTSSFASTSPTDVNLPRPIVFENLMISFCASSNEINQRNSKHSASSSSIWQFCLFCKVDGTRPCSYWLKFIDNVTVLWSSCKVASSCFF